MTHSLMSAEADALLSFDDEDRIRYLRAEKGAYIDASTTGWRDGYTLWGPVDVIGDPDPLFRMTARDGRLHVGSAAQDVPELVPHETPKDGVYVYVEGGYITHVGRIENDRASILYMTFLINPAMVFRAKGPTIAVTQFTPEPETSDLDAQALYAAA